MLGRAEMRRLGFFLAGLSFLALAPVSASAATLAPALRPLQFLVGTWDGGKGVVADTGGTSSGVSTLTVEADGAVLLRKDHTDLFDKAGKPSGGFDQIMMIYVEGETLHADYQGGGHLIHYVSAVADGK